MYRPLVIGYTKTDSWFETECKKTNENKITCTRHPPTTMTVSDRWN